MAEIEGFAPGGNTPPTEAISAPLTGAKGSGIYNFWLCERGGVNCSNIITVVF